MSSRDFKKGILEVLQRIGFQKSGAVLCRDGDEAKVLVDVQKGFGEQWFINVGFLLTSLSSEIPTRVERSHLYFRVDRLFPSLRETILTAGDLADRRQQESYKQLIAHLDGELNEGLRELTSLDGLREASRAGRLSHGLVTKEAREVLTAG